MIWKRIFSKFCSDKVFKLYSFQESSQAFTLMAHLFLSIAMNFQDCKVRYPLEASWSRNYSTLLTECNSHLSWFLMLLEKCIFLWFFIYFKVFLSISLLYSTWYFLSWDDSCRLFGILPLIFLGNFPANYRICWREKSMRKQLQFLIK